MIIGTYFDGDSDDKLKMLQHGCYNDLICEWITMAGVRRLRYRTSPEWAEVTQMWEHFREEGYFDHRKIQMPHDLIAARFRIMAQEMALPEDAKEEAWYAFFKAEAAAWLKHDGFLRCFMIALSIGCNRPPGCTQKKPVPPIGSRHTSPPGSLRGHDLMILDELGCLPFSKAGGQLQFYLISKPYERTSLIITTNLSFG